MENFSDTNLAMTSGSTNTTEPINIPTDRKIVVAMSGGVDSSLVACLLKQKGYDVSGATFLLTADSNLSADKAREICDKIGIKHYVIDMRKLFEDRVKRYFANAYINGETPNPCVICNREIKFGFFVEWAVENGFYHVATGHYCDIRVDDNGVHLLKGNEDKDQTYFLALVNAENLKRAIFPVGKMDKAYVRELMSEFDIKMSQQKDSQDICFVQGEYAEEVKNILGENFDCPNLHEGDFVDKTGRKLGRHKGTVYYTKGQRKGLGVAMGQRVFVTHIDAPLNQVILGTDEELFTRKVNIRDLNIINRVSFDEGMRNQSLSGKIRFGKSSAGIADIRICKDEGVVLFEKDVRAVVKGQILAIYNGDECVAGAIIAED